MNIMVSELYDALISAGADEAKARRAAEGLAGSDQEFRKQFSELREDNQKMRTEMTSLRGELVGAMTVLRSDLVGSMTNLKGELTGAMSVLKGDTTNAMTSLDGSLRREMQGLRSELSLVKWMAGVVLGLLIAILLRVYLV